MALLEDKMNVMHVDGMCAISLGHYTDESTAGPAVGYCDSISTEIRRNLSQEPDKRYSFQPTTERVHDTENVFSNAVSFPLSSFASGIEKGL